MLLNEIDPYAELDWEAADFNKRPPRKPTPRDFPRPLTLPRQSVDCTVGKCYRHWPGFGRAAEALSD